MAYDAAISPFRQRVEHTGDRLQAQKSNIFAVAHKLLHRGVRMGEKNMTENSKLHGIAFIVTTMTWFWIIFNVHKIGYIVHFITFGFS